MRPKCTPTSPLAQALGDGAATTVGAIRVFCAGACAPHTAHTCARKLTGRAVFIREPVESDLTLVRVSKIPGEALVVPLGVRSPWLAAVLWLTCVSCSDEKKSITIPAELDSGFSLQHDAFAFVNFASDTGGAQLDPDLVARMFGPEVACEDGQMPCVSTAIADSWRQGVNETLHEGRSEGMAVLSLLMSMGEVNPKDFGAATAGDLRIEGNIDLQRELAYWAALQQVPGAVQGDVRFSAKDVMPFLTKALDPEGDERYRLALAVKTPGGFVRGHGLVPIAFFRTAPDVYTLRVYDSNLPINEQDLVIDVAANTWRYEVPMPSGDTLVYEGNEENGNLLYFSPVRQRLGTQVAPFGPSSPSMTLTTSGAVQVSAAIGENEAAGIEDGQVVERGSGRLVPSFSACPLCNPSRGALNYTLSGELEKPLVVDVKAGSHGAGAGVDGVSRVGVVGKNFATTVEGVDTEKGTTTTLSVEPDGDATFSSSGQTDVTVTSTRVVGGKESESTVTVSGAGEGTRTISLTVDSEGRPTVDTSGLPEGATVTASFTVTTANGEKKTSTVEISVKGGGTQLKVDPDTGTVRSVDEVCNNGKFDKVFEVDTDCGDTCTKGCGNGQRCRDNNDCFDKGLTPDGTFLCLGDSADKLRCVEQGCEDGYKTGFETGVDCGSVQGNDSKCGPCAATNDAQPPGCDSNDDCDNNFCFTDNTCRLKNRMTVIATGAPAGVTLTVVADIDRQRRTIEAQATGAASTRIELPEGFDYGFIALYGSGDVACLNGTSTTVWNQRTGYDPTRPGVVDREVTFACGRATGDLSLATSGLPDGAKVTLNFDYTNPTRGRITEPRTITSNGTTQLASFRGNWALEVTSQPGQIRTDGTSYYVACSFNDQSFTLGSLERETSNSVELQCVKNPCPYKGLCTGKLNLQVAGLPSGTTFRLRAANGNERVISQNGAVTGLNERQTWTISDIPGQRGTGDSKTFTECLFSDGSTTRDLIVNGADINETITCTEHPCPYGNKCVGVLLVGTTGLSSGLTVNVSGTTINANGSTSLGAVQGNRALKVDRQPGEHLVSQSKFYNECLWSNGTESITATVSGADVTETLSCTDHACPYKDLCTTGLNVDVQGLPAGVSVDLRATVGGQVTTRSPSGAGTVKITDARGDYQLEVTSQPGVVTLPGGDTHVACVWSNGQESISGTLSGAVVTLVLSCTATSCPNVLCAEACTLDSDCNNNSCECGVSSGNCAGDSGTCSRLKGVFDDPTTDGTIPTGTFTVPAGCSEVFIQAWGAAGGSQDPGDFIPFGNRGGSGGYVSGTLSAAQGDVFTIWVGQGGAFNDTGPGGTPGIGSNLGERADGGFGDVDFTGMGAGGGGGGLTSFRQTGSVTRSVLVPAGGGGSSQGVGGDVGTAGGGTETGAAGGSATLGSNGGGGGAGENGGAGSQAGEAGLPGSYSVLPIGLTSTDPTDDVVPNASVNDYAACLGVDGTANAGTAGPMNSNTDWGGDGCVVIRCVGE